MGQPVTTLPYRSSMPTLSHDRYCSEITPEDEAEWLVDLTGDAIVWHRVHGKAAVTVRAPLTELLLLVHRRRPVNGDGIEVLGDAALLDFWLDRVAFA